MIALWKTCEALSDFVENSLDESHKSALDKSVVLEKNIKNIQNHSTLLFFSLTLNGNMI